MPEEHAEKHPGHLDVDAVSAYVDQDFDPVDLATIAIHLKHCPACHREVLEIRTTVFLLGGLPQYAPRRSFRLGHEHARASRRPDRARGDQPWTGSYAVTGQPGASVALSTDNARGASWMSGLQVAAMVVGALLLLVTAGDLTGFVSDPPSPMQLAAPTAAAGLPTPPQAAMPPAEAPRAEPAEVRSATNGALESAPAGFAADFQETADQSGGTEDRDSASEEMPEAESAAQPAARSMATVPGVAAVTQAIPTPGASNAPSGEGTAVKAVAPESAVSEEQPSRILIVQLALGVMLAWLIVSIAGLRWVRRVR